MMNHRQLTSAVRSYLGDVLEGNKKLAPGEILAFVNQGQNVVAGALWDIERELFAATATIPAINGTASYTMPVDTREIIRIEYAGVENERIPISQLSGPKRQTHQRALKGFQQWYTPLGSTLGKSLAILNPIPDDTSNIIIHYYRRPTDFHEKGSYSGPITTSTSATQFTDTAAPFAGTTGTTLDTFWQGATVRFTSLANINQVQRVASWVAATGVFTTEAFTNAPGAGATYELDQVSIVPEQFHHLIAMYAAYLGASKLQIQSPWMQLFDMELQMMRAKWLNNVRPNVPGQTQYGIGGGTATVNP